MDIRPPTSSVLRCILNEAHGEHMTLASMLEALGDRSFGVVMLLLGLLALVPSLSIVTGVLLMWPAFQMIMARRAPSLPRWISQRPLLTARLTRLVDRVVPVLVWMERMVRPRWRTPFESTKRVVGAVIVLLALTMLGPVPFSHVLPALVIVLIAFAYLEEDGALLTIALGAALLSLAITVATVWGTILGIEAID
ncbi:exopolysaccharide biosynthesis protein [Vineibacter terrae]|uniref:Exopolysaccharide biosynthesis protein n=1 Tax=Vineibacter terrae TaxID=2586908 RepID=A0A5C8PLE1_9HYPH|nr:exopolysaccharide biosynthesis protein [Vineibacter terrae]TXL74823.1 exopolysaccharide biosynthesis protein [Vineibacter terrae]